jgi:hypothetical protein
LVAASIGALNSWAVLAMKLSLTIPLLRAIRSFNGRTILAMLFSELIPPSITLGPLDGRAVIPMKNAMEIPKPCSVTLNLYLYAVFFLCHA